MRIFKKSNIEFKNEKPQASSNKLFGSVKDYIDNQKLTRTTLTEQLPFLLYLAFFAIVYIANQYHAERLVNEVKQLEKQRSEKRAEYISAASDLMKVTRQSEVIELLKEKNIKLKPLTSPPKKIIIQD